MTVLLVTHSADFVASAATDLLHLDHFAKTITTHKGDVWNFLNGFEGRYKSQCKEYNAQQSQLKELKSKGLTGEKALQKLLKTPGATKVFNKPKEYSVKFRFPSSGDDRSTIAVLDAG
jgi:ATP-binding cassette subfamily F protein 1